MPTPQHSSNLRASRLYLLRHAARVRAQRRILQATIEQLPDSPPPWEGEVSGPAPLRVLVAGDSAAAGLGVPSQEKALVGQLAQELSARTGRGVLWRAVGSTGADTASFLEHHLTNAVARPVDFAYVSLGANDALRARSARAYARDIRTLLETISDRHPEALVLVANLPVYALYEIIPEPTRGVLHRHARALERAARRVVDRDPRWFMPEALLAYDRDFFARDGFHPSASGYTELARFALDETWRRGISMIEHTGRQPVL